MSRASIRWFALLYLVFLSTLPALCFAFVWDSSVPVLAWVLDPKCTMNTSLSVPCILGWAFIYGVAAAVIAAKLVQLSATTRRIVLGVILASCIAVAATDIYCFDEEGHRSGCGNAIAGYRKLCH